MDAKRRTVLKTIGLREYLYKKLLDIRSVNKIANGAPKPEIAKLRTVKRQNIPVTKIKNSESSSGKSISLIQKEVCFTAITTEEPRKNRTE